MEITVFELAALAGGQLHSEVDGSVKITGVAALEDALPGDVTFFADARYLKKARRTKAAAILVPANFSEEIPAICIPCADPGKAFTAVLAKFAPPPLVRPKGIHPTAHLGNDVKLGEDVCIQPFAVIEDGAVIGDRAIVGAHGYVGHGVQIGADSFLHPRVTILERCTIGKRVILHSGSVIGADGFGYTFRDGRHQKVPQTGIVEIQDDVEIGANACVDRARFGKTIIGEGSKLDNLVQVGHNAQIGKHVVLCGQVGIAGSVKIGDYTTFAGQSGTAGHLEIGGKVTVAGRGGVIKSIKDNEIVAGFPAEPMREWLENLAHLRSMSALKAKVKVLEQKLRDLEKEFPPKT